MYRQVLIVLATATVSLAGCAQPDKFTVDNPFPSAEEMGQMSAEPVSTAEIEPPEAEVVHTWELVGPFPDEIAHRPHEVAGAEEEAFYGALPADERMRTSEAMHCAAREVGHFVLEHDGLPFQSLDNFIKARCGVTAVTTNVRYAWVTGVAEDQHFEEGAVEMAEHAGKLLDGTELPVDAGFWLGRDGDKVAYVSMAGRQAVSLSPTPIVPGEDGEVVLEGEVWGEHVEKISGAINQGDFGVEPCMADPRVELPKFRVRCQAQRGDELAYFQLSTGTGNRILHDRVIQQLVWPAGEPSNVYRSPATRRALADAEAARAALASAEEGGSAAEDAEDGEDAQAAAEDAESASEAASDSENAAPADEGAQDDADEQQEAGVQAKAAPQPPGGPDGQTGADDYLEHFVSLLNEVRQQAGMAPVEHARRQSASIQSVTEQLQSAWKEGDYALSNKLVLGIMAGWDVDGAIVSAGISSEWALSQAPAALLEIMLESPGGRRTLMDPDVGTLAMGTLMRNSATKGVVASYAFVDDDHPDRRAERALEVLNDKRKAFGSGPAREIERLRAVARKLSRQIEAGEIELYTARNRLLSAVVRVHDKAAYAYMTVTDNIDSLELHRDLLTPKALPVSVVVAPYQQEGYPWTMYAVIFVYPKQPKANIAQIER